MAATDGSAAHRKHALPLVIAVTGHCDLQMSEIPGIRVHVKELLVGLAESYPDRRLSVVSPLAEGADRLVAEEALALGVDLFVPLPVPRDIYLDDFEKGGLS